MGLMLYFTRMIPVIIAVVIGLSLAGCQSSPQIVKPRIVAFAPGASGDGATINTTALQHAIDTCSAQGGGIVQIPAGRYRTGTLVLKDNVALHLDKDAVLLGSPTAADYRNLDPFKDGLGAEMGAALIVAMDAKHIAIEGAGTIDGQGKLLSAAQGGGKLYRMRPFLVRMIRCSDVTVRGVHLTSPGAWTMHFYQCNGVAAQNVTINSRGLANNDGMDVDSCSNVQIQNCDIDSGDDAICLKTTSPMLCRNIAVTNCTLKSDCGAVKVGTESLADFDGVTVTHCLFHDTKLGGIKLLSVDGAHLQNVLFSDIQMENVATPIFIRLGARLSTFHPGDERQPVGSIRNITIQNIKAKTSDKASLSPPSGIFITGIADHPVQGLTLENIAIDLPGGGTLEQGAQVVAEKINVYPEINRFAPCLPAFGIYARHVSGLQVRNLSFTLRAPDARPAAVCEDAADAKFSSITLPVGALMRGCSLTQNN